ncbi:MAG TPA: glycosyltransferase family 39 protein [Candidatus Dormibacteraeota bacterium]|nr:glycosyltransferase family 39 protein [Candidatus Dormibacteraeota bacterium]
MSSEPRSFRRTPFYLVALFVFWLTVYGSGIFRPALLDDADSVHAEAAREMVLSNDWVTLHANGIRYLEKAPLLYWSIAMSFKLFGVHDWSARLPLALGMLALIIAVYFVGWRAFNETAGWYASLAAGFTFGPYIFTRFLIPDILVGLWLILSLHFFLRSWEAPAPGRFDCWAMAACCALNVLTKGLIGLVFPVATIGLCLALTGNLRRLFKMHLLSSLMIFLAIAAPWHILAGIRNPDQGTVRGFFWFYFVNEHFLRYINKRIPRDYGTVPLGLFWGLLLVWLFPWSSFLPQALASMKNLSRRRLAESPLTRAKLVFLVSASFVVLFFSFSTRQEYYVLPALPPLALLIGAWLADEETAPEKSDLRKWGRASSLALAILGAIGGMVTFAIAVFLPVVPAGTDIADLLRSRPAESQQYALSLGHFLDLNLRVMTLFRLPLILFGTSVLLGSGLNWHFRRRSRPDLGNWALTLMSGCLLVAIHLAFTTFSPLLTSKPLADAIARVHQPGDIIEINGEYEGGSSLNYYTGHQVRILNGRSANLWYGSFFPDAPQIFDDTAFFQRMWVGPQRIFLWTEAEEQDKALAGINRGTVFPLARSGGKLVLTNRPWQ